MFVLPSMGFLELMFDFDVSHMVSYSVISAKFLTLNKSCYEYTLDGYLGRKGLLHVFV